MQSLFNTIYKNRTVLVTGHTGFKGSWICHWLKSMGANVIGYSLEAPTNPNHINIIDPDIISIIGDINDFEKLNNTLKKYKPDIVFHLAAQALVRESYLNPIETYETNVLGTLKVFEASKQSKVKAIVNITSDKSYENKEWIWGYREIDPLGGHDPYSSSKACADILATSYRNSYFNNNNFKKSHNTLLATCRAGNVIGGGDWAKDRLLTDIILSIVNNKVLELRNPNAIRPWQHVLEPLCGYLLIGQKLLEENLEFAQAWNFGPNSENNISVLEVVKEIKNHWNNLEYKIISNKNNLHEANLLKLDCSKANSLLKWKSIWNSKQTFEKTALWYKNYYEENKINTYENLINYINDAKKQDLEWTR